MTHDETAEHERIGRRLQEVERELTVAHAYVMHKGHWQEFVQGDWQKKFFSGKPAATHQYGADPSPEKLLEATPVKPGRKVT